MPQSRREREHEEFMRKRNERPAQPTVSFEEALPCHVCKQPRKIVRGPFALENNPTSQGYYVKCMNKDRCRMADDPGVGFIQVLSSGRVPIMLPGEKVFDIPQLSPEQQKQVDEYYDAQYDRTREGDELRKDL